MRGNMRQTLAVLVCLLLVQSLALAGVSNFGVRYVGGSYTDVKVGQKGKFDYSDNGLVFHWKKVDHLLLYDSITSIEYGQKVGRRIGATIGLGITTLGLAALPLLLSKKRKHFATIGYIDEDGVQQALVIEFGKRATKAALNTLSLRSGVALRFESDKAREQFRH